MRRLVIAAVAAAVLAGAPAAAAKEVTSATVCGADGCTTTQDRSFLQALMNGGGPADPPAHPSGAYRVRAKISEPGAGVVARFTNWWVPQTQLLLAEDGSWIMLSPRATEAVASAAHGHKPFGPEKLGSSFADTSSHAAPPPPVNNAGTNVGGARTNVGGAGTNDAAASDGGGGSVDLWVIVLGAGIALAAAGAALVLVRRRPGGATP